MKRFDISNVITLVKFSLLISKKTIFWWTVIITAFMVLYMILFPSIQEMAQLKFDNMPQEILQFMGMEAMSDMGNYTSYFSIIYGLILIPVSIFSATFSSGLITKEETSKSIEYISTLAVSRTEIYVSKYITSTLAVCIILGLAIVSTIVCGLINGGETFVITDIISSVKQASFTALLFGGAGFFLSAISSKTGSGTAASCVVIASYMLGYLGEILGHKGEFLLYFSPFITLSINNTLDMSGNYINTLIVYFLIYIVLIFSGCKAYNKRDFKV